MSVAVAILSAAGCAPRLLSANLYRPLSISISASNPLYYASLIPGAGATAALGGSTPAIAGSTPGAGGSNGGSSGAVPALAGSTPAYGGSVPSNTPPAVLNATAQWNIDIALNATFSPGAAGACKLNPPFASRSCSLTGFAIPNTAVSSAQGLSVNAYAKNGLLGDELKSNVIGTTYLGVRQIADTSGSQTQRSGINGSLTAFNGALYFYARNANDANKLFKLSTSGALTQITNIFLNQTGDDFISDLVVFNQSLYFLATSQAVYGAIKMYRVNTSDVVTQVSNITNDQSLNDAPTNLTVFNNALYFVATNQFRQKIYKLSTSNVISQVSDVMNDQLNSDEASGLTVFNNELYFTARNPVGAHKLYKIDASDNIIQVSNIQNSQFTDDNPQNLKVSGSYLYFTAQCSAGAPKLFRVDTSGVVTQISNLSGIQGSSDSIGAGVTFNGEYYFSADNDQGFKKLYKVGASGVITQVSNITNDQYLSDDPKNFYVFNNKLYFSAKNATALETKLYSVDTSGTIVQVADFGTGDNYPTSMIAYGGALYFLAGVGGVVKLYRTDGQTVSQVLDITPNVSDFDETVWGGSCGGYDFSNAVVFQNYLYFAAYVDHSACFDKLYRLCDASLGCTP